MYEKLPIGEFFEMYFAALENDGYGEGIISTRKRHCCLIVEFARKCGDKMYSPTLGQTFWETYSKRQELEGFALRTETDTNRVFRTVSMLNDFYQGAAFKRLYLKPQNTVLSDRLIKLSNDFISHLADKGFAKSSMGVFKRVTKRYLEYIVQENISLDELGVRNIEGLLTVFQESKPVTVKKNVQVLKHLVRFLHEKRVIAFDFSEQIPCPRIYRKSNIPSVWPADDLARIFSVIDLDTPIGKRNKIILLLASRLGLRGSDIRSLRLSDIDWENDAINFIQSKTLVPITLPLLPEVGEAIIDYLRYGRPVSKSREIILRHNAPFEPFESNTGFNNIIIRCANKAGVKLTSERKHGLHSLRHTLASDLLAYNVPPSTIAGLLGHTSSENVSIYLKTQDDALRECSLDIGEVVDNG